MQEYRALQQLRWQKMNEQEKKEQDEIESEQFEQTLRDMDELNRNKNEAVDNLLVYIDKISNYRQYNELDKILTDLESVIMKYVQYFVDDLITLQNNVMLVLNQLVSVGINFNVHNTTPEEQLFLTSLPSRISLILSIVNLPEDLISLETFMDTSNDETLCGQIVREQEKEQEELWKNSLVGTNT